MVKGYLKEARVYVAPRIDRGIQFLEDMFAPAFTTEWGRRASWICLFIFSLFFIITLVQTFVAWHNDWVLANTEIQVTHPSEDIAIQIAKLPEAHLFGSLKAQGNVPITSLELRLVGVIKATPEKFSRVIISESGKPGKVYSIGDSLPSGISINSVTDDGVVLDNGGHLEKLPLQRQPLTFHGMPKGLDNIEERE